MSVTLRNVIGASLSEPHLVVSAAALSILLSLSGTSVIPYTCALLFLREIFEIVQLRIIAWGGLGTRLNNAIQHAHGKCGRLWERG